MSALSAMVDPTLRLNFGKSLILPPRLTFARSGTATYRDPMGATKTAQANSPRLGQHPSNDNLRSGLVLTTGETCTHPAVSEFINTAAGTMLWVGSLESIATSSILWGLTDGVSSSNYLRLRIDSATAGRLRFMSSVATVVQFTSDVVTMAVNTRYAIAVAWSGTQVQIVTNDGVQATATSASGVPGSLTTLAIGSTITGISGNVMQGVVERLQYWPVAATLTQMRRLTTL